MGAARNSAMPLSEKRKCSGNRQTRKLTPEVHIRTRVSMHTDEAQGSTKFSTRFKILLWLVFFHKLTRALGNSTPIVFGAHAGTQSYAQATKILRCTPSGKPMRPCFMRKLSTTRTSPGCGATTTVLAQITSRRCSRTSGSISVPSP